jgi:hypothetical protein
MLLSKIRFDVSLLPIRFVSISVAFSSIAFGSVRFALCATIPTILCADRITKPFTITLMVGLKKKCVIYTVDNTVGLEIPTVVLRARIFWIPVRSRGSRRRRCTVIYLDSFEP